MVGSIRHIMRCSTHQDTVCSGKVQAGPGVILRRRLARYIRGGVAEWLGSGLQSRAQRFDSARRLDPAPREASLARAGFPIQSPGHPLHMRPTSRWICSIVIAALCAPVTTGAAELEHCRAGQLHLRYAGFDGAAGHNIYHYGVWNRSDHACRLGGYYDVKVFRNGHVMDIDKTNVDSARMFTLGADDTAGFAIETDHSRSCVHADRLEFRAPDTTRWISRDAGYFNYCKAGGIGIWPLKD